MFHSPVFNSQRAGTTHPRGLHTLCYAGSKKDWDGERIETSPESSGSLAELEVRDGSPDSHLQLEKSTDGKEEVKWTTAWTRVSRRDVQGMQ